MTIYFKSKNGMSLVKLGNVLTIGGSKRNYLLTGETESTATLIAKYENSEEAQEALDNIINKITHPTVKESQTNCIYIQL